MNKYKKLNIDWNSKLEHVLQAKENIYETKINENIEKIEKRHSRDRKAITEGNVPKLSENVDSKLGRINMINEIIGEVIYK